MKKKENQTEQKLLGAYYTPDKIVDFIIDWTIEKDNSQKILEPSAGDGQFIKRIKQIHKNSKITAVEINENESRKIPQNLDCEVEVINADFYRYYEENRLNNNFDIVFGNPPYIRYQFLTETQREFQSDILINNGLKPNKLINSWVAFAVSAIEFLKPGGKFAFVLPTDLLQVSYAKQLRSFFKEVFSELNIVTFENLVFEGIQQDVIIVLGIKKNKPSQSLKLRTIHIYNEFELSNSISSYDYDDYTDFQKDKWSSLNLGSRQRKYYDKCLKKQTISFTDIVKIEVGITTGNNKFFVVNQDVINEFSLEEYKKPLLGRSVETYGITYTNNDLASNNIINKNIWLLDFNDKKLNYGAQKYITNGEKSNEHDRYKLKIRNKWYEVPSIWIPDAFLLRRIGQYPKIIQNLSNTVSTDTFHRIKLYESDGYNLEEIIFLFYSSPTLLSIELEGRVFGGGALEILPGDMKNIRLPLVDKIENISVLFKELDDKFRNNESIFSIVKWVDEKIQKYCESNIDFDLTYDMWINKNMKRIK